MVRQVQESQHRQVTGEAFVDSLLDRYSYTRRDKADRRAAVRSLVKQELDLMSSGWSEQDAIRVVKRKIKVLMAGGGPRTPKKSAPVGTSRGGSGGKSETGKIDVDLNSRSSRAGALRKFLRMT